MDAAPPPIALMEQQDPAITPDWAKDAVWYQVFPERFRNGAPQSDPQPEDIGGAPPGWRVSPWGMEWYGRDTCEQPGVKTFWDTVFHQRFGGDLIGLRAQLPHLQKLGINAIYLNPIFQARSLHKYDATTYHHIDPTLGPDRAGDLRAIAAANETEDPATWIWTAADRFFLELVADIHARGMRIILDGVFNHSGTACFAFRYLQKNGRASRYADWYQVTRWHPDGTFDYSSWDGAGILPNFGRDETNLHPGVKKYIFDITRRWMDPSGQGRPEEGIDGWRLDVAFCVPHAFWREWHAHVRAINPNAYTTAEIVGPAQEWLQPGEFDAVMNYEWTYPTLSFFTPAPHAIPAREFRQRINTLHARHAPGTIHILQNLLDSHDTGRVLTLFESQSPAFTGWDTYFHWAKTANTPELKTSRPGPAARQALQLAAAWQMTGPGAPMLYYGTEVGMWGANDPCDRQPMLWQDIHYQDETRDYRGPLLTPNSRQPDWFLFAFYQRLIAIRHAQPALRRGSFAWIPCEDENTLAFQRQLDDDTLWILINKNPHPITWQLPTPGRDLWAAADFPASPLSIPKQSFKIIRLVSEP